MALKRNGPGLFEKREKGRRKLGHDSSDGREAEASEGEQSTRPVNHQDMDRMTLYLPYEAKASLEQMLLDLRVAHRVNIPLTGLVRAVLSGVLQSEIDLGRAYSSRDRAMVEAEIARLMADRLAGP